jgi:hypothetical protein
MSKHGRTGPRNSARTKVEVQRALRLRQKIRRSMPSNSNAPGERPQQGPYEQVIVRNPQFEAIVHRYQSLSGMSRTTGEAEHPAQAVGGAIDALVQLLGLISRVNGNSAWQQGINRYEAILASMRKVAAEAASDAVVYVGENLLLLPFCGVVIWGTEMDLVREVASENGLIFKQHDELTKMLHTMRRHAALLVNGN